MADVGNPAISAVEDCTELAELGNGLEPGISSNAATTPTFFGDGKAGGSKSPVINYEPTTAMLALCSCYVVL